MPQPVKALWYRRTAAGRRRSSALAIVGARAATAAGCRLAHELAASAARHGFAIVSGGALGIDAAAHRGALDAGGATFAVLGCGVDVIYPDRHAALYADVAARGRPALRVRAGHAAARRTVSRAQPDHRRAGGGGAGRRGGLRVRRADHRARSRRRSGAALLAVPGSPGTDELIATGAARAVADAEASAPRRSRARRRRSARRAAALRAALAALRAGEAAPGRAGAPPGLAARPRRWRLIAEAELDGWLCRRPGGALASMESARGN